MIHISADFVKNATAGSQEFLWGNIFNSISRLGVPLFVMISGALLLDEKRDTDIKTIFGKNIKNIVILFFLWSGIYAFVYYILKPVFTGENIDVEVFFSRILLGHYHMWYLYMNVGLYMITPFLRKFVKKENKREVQLFLILCVIFQFSRPVIQALCPYLSICNVFMKVLDKFHLYFFSGYSAYYVLGWYLVNVGICEKKYKKLLYLFAAVALGLVFFYVWKTGECKIGYNNLNIFILVYSAAVFYALYSMHVPSWMEQIETKKKIVYLSGMSFGIYILHPFFIPIVSYIHIFIKNPALYLLCAFILAFMISLLITYILSKISLLRKAVRM